MVLNKLRKGERRSIGNLRSSPRTSLDVAADEGRFPDAPSSPRSPTSAGFSSGSPTAAARSAVHPELNHPTLVHAPSQQYQNQSGYEDQETLHIRLRDEAARRAADSQSNRRRTGSMGAGSTHDQGSPTSLRYGHAKSLSASSTGSAGTGTAGNNPSWYMTTGVMPRASVNDDTRARKYNSIYRASGLGSSEGDQGQQQPQQQQDTRSNLIYSPSVRSNRTTPAGAYARDHGAGQPQSPQRAIPSSPLQQQQQPLPPQQQLLSSSPPRASEVPMVPVSDIGQRQPQTQQQFQPVSQPQQQLHRAPQNTAERQPLATMAPTASSQPQNQQLPSASTGSQRVAPPAFEVSNRAPTTGPSSNFDPRTQQQQTISSVAQSQPNQRSSSLSPNQQNTSRFTEQFSDAGTVRGQPGTLQSGPSAKSGGDEGAAAIGGPTALLTDLRPDAKRDEPMQDDRQPLSQAGLSSRDFANRGAVAQDARAFPSSTNETRALPSTLAGADPRTRHPSGPRELAAVTDVPQSEREKILSPPPALRRISTAGTASPPDQEYELARESLTPDVQSHEQQSRGLASGSAAPGGLVGALPQGASTKVTRTPTYGPEHQTQTSHVSAPQQILSTERVRYTDTPAPNMSFAAPSHPQYSSLPTNIGSKIPHYMFVKYEAEVCQECVASDQKMHALQHGGQSWRYFYSDPQEEQELASDDPNTRKTGRKEFNDNVYLAKTGKGDATLGEDGSFSMGGQCTCDGCLRNRMIVRKAAEAGVIEEIFEGRRHPLSETITTTTTTTIVRAPIIEETIVTVPCTDPNCSECLRLAEEHRKKELSDLLEQKLRGMVIHRTDGSNDYDAENMWLSGAVDEEDGVTSSASLADRGDGAAGDYLSEEEYEYTGLSGMSRKMHLLLSRAGNPRQERLRANKAFTEGRELQHSDIVQFDMQDHETGRDDHSHPLGVAVGQGQVGSGLGYGGSITAASGDGGVGVQETGMRELAGDQDGYSLREQQQESHDGSEVGTVGRRTADTRSVYSQA